MSLVDEPREMDGEEATCGWSQFLELVRFFWILVNLRTKIYIPFQKSFQNFTSHKSKLNRSSSSDCTNRFLLWQRRWEKFSSLFVLVEKEGREGARRKRGEFSCDTREKRGARTRANTARVLFARVTSSYVSATKNNGRRWGTKGTFRKHSRNNRVNADRSYASLATPFIHRLSCLSSPFAATHGFEREKGRNSRVENRVGVGIPEVGSFRKVFSLREILLSVIIVLVKIKEKYLFLFFRFGERGQWKWVLWSKEGFLVSIIRYLENIVNFCDFSEGEKYLL